MAKVTRTNSPFSRYGLGRQVAVDAAALSDQALYRILTFTPAKSTAAGASGAGYFVQNTTQKYSLGPIGVRGYVRGAYQSFETVPAGGTLAAVLKAYDASATAEVTLTASVDPETATARVGQALAEASTNILLEPTDTLEWHLTADNNTVTQDAVEPCVTILFQPVEAVPPTRTEGVG